MACWEGLVDELHSVQELICRCGCTVTYKQVCRWEMLHPAWPLGGPDWVKKGKKKRQTHGLRAGQVV